MYFQKVSFMKLFFATLIEKECKELHNNYTIDISKNKIKIFISIQSHSLLTEL